MTAAMAEINLQPNIAADSRDTVPLHPNTLIFNAVTRWDHSGYSHYFRKFYKRDIESTLEHKKINNKTSPLFFPCLLIL